MGATVTFTDVPLEDFNVPGGEGPAMPSPSRHGDQNRPGELDFELGDLPGGEGLPNIDELPPAPSPS